MWQNTEKLNAAIEILRRRNIIKNAAQLAVALDYSKGVVSEYINGKKAVSDAFILKFEKKFNLNFENIVLDDSKNSDMENLNAGENENKKNDNNIENNVINNKALLSLIDANRVYADCHRDLTTAHVKAVDLNSELAAMLKMKITDNEIRDILEDDGARLRVFQELLIQIGLGKGWASEEEGRSEIHRLVSDALLKV